MESSPRSRWLRREDMKEAPVTAATGALGPVIAKLAALLGSEYKLRWRTRRDINFIRSNLKPVHSLLWNICEREELDDASRALMMKVLDLADDVDDAIDDFILSMDRSRNNKRLIQTKMKASPFQLFKKQASDVSGRCRSKWKKPSLRLFSCGKLASNHSRPRAYPFVRKDASELVGMAGPRDTLIKHLVGNDETTPLELQLKKGLIFGSAGMGKTTLADLVYEAIEDNFQSKAFVSVTPGGSNMREVLARILQQVVPNSTVPLAGTEEDLIHIISNFLNDKRYLVIIDDIWNSREWEVIMKSLPENNLGSRIVGTTRTNAVAENWRYGPNNFCLVHDMLPDWNAREGWLYKIDDENIPNWMIAMKAELLEEGFDYEHPIVHMCGGTPLAVLCMLSAVAREREKQAQQGLHAKACEIQAEIFRHVMENGIQNTPGFEPLAESLQLGFDDLPHHMLKTCLLYCSIYPDGHDLKRKKLVKRWISEGFSYKEEESNSYFEELVSRGLILCAYETGPLRMQPMMRNFLRWKSRQYNFSTCSSEITPSYNNSSRIRRLLMCDEAEDPLFVPHWSHIRSLIVYQGRGSVPFLKKIERVPFGKLEGVRVLDLCEGWGLLDHHLKDICGLVRLRHLLGLNGDRFKEAPPEIVRLQCLETFEASGEGFAQLAGFIGSMQQLKTLDVNGEDITELPREIGALQQLQTLRIRYTDIVELPREVWSLQQLKTLDIGRTKITVLPKEIGELQQLKTLDIRITDIAELPKEIGKLKQLKTLDISGTRIAVLPTEIGELQQLKTLDISSTQITGLPKEIGELQHLEHLLMNETRVAKIPGEIGALKELKSLIFDYNIAALPLEVCALVELPECIHQALNTSGLVSELAGEMISFRKSLYMHCGGLVVSAKHMHIPLWIREHFNNVELLDIRICKLEEQGLKILREMPQLQELTLCFEIVPKEPVVISGEGFAMLKFFTVDSRVPRVTFQEGAMPILDCLIFKFQFYAGPPNKGPVGVNHLRSLRAIIFECNKNWYSGRDSPCISPTIDVVRKEARELPSHRPWLHEFFLDLSLPSITGVGYSVPNFHVSLDQPKCMKK